MQRFLSISLEDVNNSFTERNELYYKRKFLIDINWTQHLALINEQNRNGDIFFFIYIIINVLR